MITDKIANKKAQEIIGLINKDLTGDEFTIRQVGLRIRMAELEAKIEELKEKTRFGVQLTSLGGAFLVGLVAISLMAFAPELGVLTVIALASWTAVIMGNKLAFWVFGIKE